MPGKPTHPLHSQPVANYSSAIARAVEWLGDRYLLAKPIAASLRRRLSPSIPQKPDSYPAPTSGHETIQ
jgi:hypothetical protein